MREEFLQRDSYSQWPCIRKSSSFCSIIIQIAVVERVSKAMGDRYTQVGLGHHGSPNFSLLDEPHLLAGIEEASLTDLEATPSFEDHIGNVSHASLDTGQFSIPRKPVGDKTAMVSEIPAKSTQVEKGKQSTQSRGEVPRQAHIFKNWWIEIGACVLSLVALVAIVATLQPHQGKPLPQWPYRISANTLISVYAVVLKVTILSVTAEGLGQLKWRRFQRDRPLDDLVKYDQATRGPLGAISLLWHLRLRHPLSSVGALITLVILAVDPFTQQIIHYYDCSVPMAGLQATIPRTNTKFPTKSEGNSTDVGFDSRAAINAGMTSSNGLVSPTCLTGNCTFMKDYGTIAYCSSCTEVTEDLTVQSRIVQSNFTNILDATINGTNGTISQNFTGPAFLANTNVFINTSLPSGLSVSSSPGAAFNFTTMGVNTQQQDNRVEIIVGKQVQLFDPVTGQLPTGCNESSTNDTWYCKGYGAASCSLAPCVRTYTSTMKAGQLYETSVSTSNQTLSSWGYMVPDSPESSVPPNFLSMVDTTCLSEVERLSLLKAGYHLDPSTRWLAYNLTFDPDDSGLTCQDTANDSNNIFPQCQNVSSHAPFPESMLSHECLYILDNICWGSLGEYLDDYFQGTVEGEVGLDSIDVIKGPQNLQTIYNYGNVSFDRVNEIFQNISNSMTKNIRQNNFGKWSNPAEGVVMHDQTCLSVRWPWLAFPAVLVLLTVVFFVAMIIDTRPTRSRAPIWKSSLLALLFHGFEPQDKYRAVVGDLSEMEELEKDIIVRLSPTEGGLKLVEPEAKHTKNA